MVLFFFRSCKRLSGFLRIWYVRSNETACNIGLYKGVGAARHIPVVETSDTHQPVIEIQFHGRWPSIVPTPFPLSVTQTSKSHLKQSIGVKNGLQWNLHGQKIYFYLEPRSNPYCMIQETSKGTCMYDLFPSPNMSIPVLKPSAVLLNVHTRLRTGA